MLVSSHATGSSCCARKSRWSAILSYARLKKVLDKVFVSVAANSHPSRKALEDAHSSLLLAQFGNDHIAGVGRSRAAHGLLNSPRGATWARSMNINTLDSAATLSGLRTARAARARHPTSAVPRPSLLRTSPRWTCGSWPMGSARDVPRSLLCTQVLHLSEHAALRADRGLHVRRASIPSFSRCSPAALFIYRQSDRSHRI